MIIRTRLTALTACGIAVALIPAALSPAPHTAATPAFVAARAPGAAALADPATPAARTPAVPTPAAASTRAGSPATPYPTASRGSSTAGNGTSSGSTVPGRTASSAAPSPSGNTAGSSSATTYAAAPQRQPSPVSSTPAAPGTVAAARPTPPAEGSDACGARIYKADGTPWVCTFDDEFSGSSLDPAKWSAWNGVNYNTPGLTCYYSDPSHVWVANGYLNLAVTKLAAPSPCATLSGTVMSTYGGAVVHGKYLFSQTGGRFEARIRFAGGVGLHDAFWLWPQNDNALYPGHAEIDIAEAWGALPNSVYAATHVTGANGGDAGASRACSVPDFSGGFHTYTLEWVAGGAMTFSVDGTRCMSFTNASALSGYAASAPFDQPFFMILQTLVDDGSYAPAPDASTVFPAVTQVDYVRVWK